jgi:hypothetical protein
MAQATTAIRQVKTDLAFSWQGTDKKGNKVRGRMVAASEQALRAELRRQGARRRHRRFQPPIVNDAGRRHTAGAVLRDRGRWP